ncbi:MAG: hypothetical protein NTZ11_17530 [Gammaproteobacteria bacterium]|nr:hypothetical protein [Gammaproteobacteria bacterium]
MHYSKDPVIDRQVRLLLQAGWRYRRGTKHGILVSNGRGNLVVPGTPSDHRSALNFRAQVRRMLRREAGA